MFLCNVAGGFWGLFFPLINIPLLLSSFLPLMLIIMLAKNNVINSTDGEKDWGKGSAWAFSIYYILSFLIVFIAMKFSCDVGVVVAPLVSKEAAMAVNVMKTVEDGLGVGGRGVQPINASPMAPMPRFGAFQNVQQLRPR